MTSKEALQCLYIGVGKAYTGRDIYEAKAVLEKQLDLLENLLRSKYIQAGFYIELDKPCIMILNEEGKVLDWIDIDFEILQEVKNV